MWKYKVFYEQSVKNTFIALKYMSFAFVIREAYKIQWALMQYDFLLDNFKTLFNVSLVLYSYKHPSRQTDHSTSVALKSSLNASFYQGTLSASPVYLCLKAASFRFWVLWVPG